MSKPFEGVINAKINYSKPQKKDSVKTEENQVMKKLLKALSISRMF